MPAIGILGGMGPQASAKLYELIIAGTSKYSPAALDEDFPEIVLLNVPVPNFISNKTNMPEARRMLIERTKLLEKAGSTINGIACNTVHVLLPELQAATSVPFLAIPQLVADKIKELGFRRVGLLATPTTLNSTLYDHAIQRQAEIIRPDVEFAEQIESYIYKKLDGTLSKTDESSFKNLVQTFRRENSLDAVILGCTELPLVYGESLDDESTLDTLQLLADGLLKEYFSSKS